MGMIAYTVKLSGRSFFVVEWTDLTVADATGFAFQAPAWSEKSIQVYGAFGVGGIVTIEGCNDFSETNWVVLKNGVGNDLTILSAKLETVLENTYAIRPRITGGNGDTKVTVAMVITTTR